MPLKKVKFLSMDSSSGMTYVQNSIQYKNYNRIVNVTSPCSTFMQFSIHGKLRNREMVFTIPFYFILNAESDSVDNR